MNLLWLEITKQMMCRYFTPCRPCFYHPHKMSQIKDVVLHSAWSLFHGSVYSLGTNLYQCNLAKAKQTSALMRLIIWPPQGRTHLCYCSKDFCWFSAFGCLILPLTWRFAWSSQYAWPSYGLRFLCQQECFLKGYNEIPQTQRTSQPQKVSIYHDR